ncbi:hypothetical protein MLD38_036411 [Melastoma candidum]|uniref:Uncharacterized protein n=1 Tax=Melastoma candidum TaxID=119954 RepID=A0ACB9LLG9_9MYRT|nr:hypothetical protein MLD38_036411 [Melastoma candidum]
MGDEDSCTKSLGRLAVFYYGSGHMLNDITAACWFTYLLVFLTDIGLSPRGAAVVMLSGQVADALATVSSGELIDRFGHFKLWHLGGSVLVAVSFSSVFGGCVPCKIFGSNSLLLQTIGYSVFAAIFNIGWAATQVSHMSMINCITLNSTSRVVLASCRNAFTMIANLSLYAVAMVIFSAITAMNVADIENQYRWIAYISIIIGCCFVGVFHLGTKEPRLKIGALVTSRGRIPWKHWFKKVLYYQVAIVYVITRLVVNVSQAYVAFFVVDDLQMPHSAKALVPAIIYICSFVVSVILQEVEWSSQRLKAYYSVGGILWVFSGVAVFLLPRSLSPLVYCLAMFIGVANALLMVTGVSMQSVLVGEDLHGCAFVCGSLSFMDKMSCGIVLYILQSYQNTSSKLDLPPDTYVSIPRLGLGLVPAFFSVIGVAVTYTMNLHSGHLKSSMEPLLG